MKPPACRSSFVMTTMPSPQQSPQHQLHLDELPHEVLCDILCFLATNDRDMCSVSAVNTRLRTVANDDYLFWRPRMLRDMPTWRRLDSSPQLRHFLGLERSSRAQSPAAQHPLSHSFKQAYLTSCPQKMRIANGRVRGLSRRVLKKTAELDHNVYTLFSSMIKPHAYFLEVDRETSPLIGEIHLTDGILVLVVQLNDWQAHLDFLYQFLRKRKHVLRAPFDGVIYLVFNKNESSSLPIDASQIASELGEFMRRVSNVPLLVFSRQESPTRRSCSQIVDMLRLDELECAWSVREFPMRRARPSLYTLSTGWSTKLTKSTVEINRKHG